MQLEWSGLQSVLHGFLLFWVHYFSDFSIGCNNGKMMTMKKTTVQLQLSTEPCILLQSSYLYNNISSYTCVKQSIWSHKQATCPSKNFDEIIFVVEVKSTKTANLLSSKISRYTVVLEDDDGTTEAKRQWMLLNKPVSPTKLSSLLTKYIVEDTTQ